MTRPYVPKSKGPRAKTRHLFSKKRLRGLSYLLQEYKEGDRVVIICYPREHKGMPHKRFHGKIGVIRKLTRRAALVEVPIGESIKRIYARLEHLQPVKSSKN
jgi:large subunit ribosomal protein L21e